MKHVLRHLAAVTAAAVLTGGVLGGAGKLIVFGGAAPTRAEASPERAAGGITETVAVMPLVAPDAATTRPEPSASAIEAPTPKPAALSLTPFRFSGRGYLGITVFADETTFAAPFAGTVEIRLYQFIDGEVRIGSNVPSLPFFPYISVTSSDARMIYRPGALVGATELIAKDGTRVASGEQLFRVAANGRSSWSAFYDSRAPYHVAVSLQTLGGRDLDASTYFSGL